MLRLMTQDGQTFTGTDAKEIVQQMRNTQWGAPVLKRDYMVEVADRVEQMTGQRIRTTPAQGFLGDLVRAGMATLETVPDPQ